MSTTTSYLERIEQESRDEALADLVQVARDKGTAAALVEFRRAQRRGRLSGHTPSAAPKPASPTAAQDRNAKLLADVREWQRSQRVQQAVAAVAEPAKSEEEEGAELVAFGRSLGLRI